MAPLACIVVGVLSILVLKFRQPPSQVDKALVGDVTKSRDLAIDASPSSSCGSTTDADDVASKEQPSPRTSTPLRGSKKGGTGWTEKNIAATAALWELSPQEVVNLRKLGENLQDVHHFKNSAAEVVRFLRARPNSLPAAETMFRNMVQWRLDNKVDGILDEYQAPALFQSHYPGGVMRGLDKAGDPVYVGRLGATDGGGFLHRFGRAEMIRHGIWLREYVSRGAWLANYERQRGHPIKRVVIVEDLDGLSVAHMNPALMALHGEIMRFDQDNYPETAKLIIVIRAPLLFRTIWAMFRHFMDPGVVKKMVFCGPDDYEEVLSQYMDLSILPSEVTAKGKGTAVPGMISNFTGGKI